MPFLAQIRRMEAVSFRSFPATSTFFDGTWAIRLTAGHAAKRLNSVNPLDPSDYGDLEARLENAVARFENFGRPLVFRQTPLAPRELQSLLDDMGWSRFEESIVMVADLYEDDYSEFNDWEQILEIGDWVNSFFELSQDQELNKPGMVEVLSSITPNSGLFIKECDGSAVAAARCVQDNDLAGIFDVVTSAKHVRQGHAKNLVCGALKWAKLSGATHAWLQVVADNRAAVELYQSLGFTELYRYVYRKSPVQH